MRPLHLFLLLSFSALGASTECTLRQDAAELLHVGYSKYEGTTGVDEIEVKMKDGGSYAGLLEDGCPKRRLRRIKMEVDYKAEGKEDWQPICKKTITLKYRCSENHLYPCTTYQVRVTVDGKEIPKIFKVGPYYNDSTITAVLTDEMNKHYNAYTSQQIRFASTESSVAIQPLDICARSATVTIYKEDDLDSKSSKWEALEELRETGSLSEALIQNDFDADKMEAKTVDNLEPCTKYMVSLNLFLNTQTSYDYAEAEEDFQKTDFSSFYTMPDSEDLKEGLATLNLESKELNWDFSKFFVQDCADSDPVETKFTLKVDGVEEDQDMSGEVLLDSPGKLPECGAQVHLVVEYGKKASNWTKTVTVIDQFVNGSHIPVEESLEIDESDDLILTTDACEEVSEVMLEEVGGGSHSETFPASDFPMAASNVSWEGCSSYRVKVKKSGDWHELPKGLDHPGWAQAINKLTLSFTETSNDSVTILPSVKCEVSGIKMQVECEGSKEVWGDEGEFDIQTIDLTVREELGEEEEAVKMTGMESNTEYACKAKLINSNKNNTESAWSPTFRIKTATTEVGVTALDPDAETNAEDTETTTNSENTLEAISNAVDVDNREETDIPLDEATEENVVETENSPRMFPEEKVSKMEAEPTNNNTQDAAGNSSEPDPSNKSGAWCVVPASLLSIFLFVFFFG